MNEITKSDMLYIWLLICGAAINLVAAYYGVLWLVQHVSVYFS